MSSATKRKEERLKCSVKLRENWFYVIATHKRLSNAIGSTDLYLFWPHKYVLMEETKRQKWVSAIRKYNFQGRIATKIHNENYVRYNTIRLHFKFIQIVNYTIANASNFIISREPLKFKKEKCTNIVIRRWIKVAFSSHCFCIDLFLCRKTKERRGKIAQLRLISYFWQIYK